VTVWHHTISVFSCFISTPFLIYHAVGSKPCSRIICHSLTMQQSSRYGPRFRRCTRSAWLLIIYNGADDKWHVAEDRNNRQSVRTRYAGPRDNENLRVVLIMWHSLLLSCIFILIPNDCWWSWFCCLHSAKTRFSAICFFSPVPFPWIHLRRAVFIWAVCSGA